MTPKYEYDQDPRYGWVNINMDDDMEGLIVIQDKDGQCHGFKFRDGEMTKTCICSAWNSSECCCVGVSWNDWDD